MKKIIYILTLFFCTIINSQSLVGKKYVAYLGSKCGGEFSSFFYTELNFKNDTVIVSNYFTDDFRITNQKEFTGTEKFNYKIENKYLTIIGSKYDKFEIKDKKLKTGKVIFEIVAENQLIKIFYKKINGGKDGLYSKLEITVDSTKYENGGNIPRYKREYSEKTKKQLWEKLIEKLNSIELKKISTVKSEKFEYYGLNEEIIIEVDKINYYILNPNFTNFNKQILEFVNILRIESENSVEENTNKK
jgi:hypothetical protein